MNALNSKPLFISVLRTAGMYLEDLEKWEFKVEGQEVRAMGPLSDASFRRLIGVVQSPVPAIVAAPATTAQAAAPADPVTASQRYFKSVSQTIDSLKAGGSMGETSSWWFQASKRIDSLPILNVDPALVAWGTGVSMKLKELSAGGKAGQTAISARASSVAEVYDDKSYYDRDGNYHYLRVPSPETDRQRRQAALEKKSQLQQQAVQAMMEMNGSRQKVRAEMTTKYHVEF